jgi:hypothetical protein
MKLFAIFIYFISLSAWALEVAFFAAPPDHPFGRYYHVALNTGSQWVHAWPYYGVTTVPNISKVGRIGIILVSPSEVSVSNAALQQEIGKTFDSSFDWNSKTGTHCTKLVADLLKIPPRKKLVPPYVGLTPEELFLELQKRNWKPKIKF